MPEQFKKINTVFKSLFKKEISYNKGSIKPHRDWKIILVFTFLILLFLGSISVYFYFQVDGGNIFSVPFDESQKEVKINKPLLDKTIGELNARKKSFEDMLLGSTTPPDPSV